MLVGNSTPWMITIGRLFRSYFRLVVAISRCYLLFWFSVFASLELNIVKIGIFSEGFTLSVSTPFNMGNDSSRLKGLEFETNAVDTNDFWSLYNAKIQTDDCETMLSIFTGETVVTGQIWVSQGPLERFLKVVNILEYQYPY